MMLWHATDLRITSRLKLPANRSNDSQGSLQESFAAKRGHWRQLSLLEAMSAPYYEIVCSSME